MICMYWKRVVISTTIHAVQQITMQSIFLLIFTNCYYEFMIEYNKFQQYDVASNNIANCNDKLLANAWDWIVGLFLVSSF